MKKHTTEAHDLKSGHRRDPVCGMIIGANENAIEYLQMHFAFCSRQCKERFLLNPYLYIGKDGRKAPKQEGKTMLKQRRLKLEQPLTPALAETVLDAVQAMMGIEHMEIEGDRITITYDLLQATEAQIESEIAQAGAALGQEWPERLRRAFVHSVEENELSSMEVRSSPIMHRH